MSERDPRENEKHSGAGDEEGTEPGPKTGENDEKNDTDEVDIASEESFPASDPPAY
ncbi:MAG: hypothetical protein QOH26_110 [Actinomycetota bacterium]|nr:hypothetical protein [Actinomycetota bacterium]